MKQVDALILAGSSNKGMLRQCSDTQFEALIPIGSRWMVEYVVQALQQTSAVNRVAVVGPVNELESLANDRVLLVPMGETMLESMVKGFEALHTAQPVLVATGDIPLLSSEAVEDFLFKCSRVEADLYYAIVPREVNEQKYPGVRRTYVKFREGVFTGGNLFVINPSTVVRSWQKGNELVRLRKKPVAICSLVGWAFVLKFILRQLTINEAEQRMSQLLGIHGVTIVSEYPEIGIDVDKPSDLELVRRVLA